MEPESNNQIDRLLRRQGRMGGDVSVAGNGHAQGSAHLDADELNAFASNAVPPAARVRYMDHLAGCTSCRRVATDLAVAANPTLAAGAAAVTAAPANSIWQRLSSWIKPPTLRYAGPVMAVLCVAVIMGVILRTQYGDRILNEQADVRVPARPNNAPVAGSAPTDQAPPSGDEVARSTVPEGVPTPASGAPQAGPSPAASRDEPTVTESVVTGEKERDGAPLLSKAPDVFGSTPAPAAPAPPPAKDADEPRAKSKNEDMEEAKVDGAKLSDSDVAGNRAQKRAEVQRRDVRQSAGSGGVVATQEQRQAPPKPADAKKPAAQTTKGGPNRSRNTEQVANQNVDREANQMDSSSRSNREGADEGEAAGRAGTTSSATRSVSGRQFRRQGNAWVDTGYVQGYGTTNVKRGSEQYRGLVADEPGLRAVAEQLSGEVIVVWKGRAYRFK